MSEKSRSDALRQEIWRIKHEFDLRDLEAQRLRQEIYETGRLPGGACTLFWLGETAYLRQIYETGRINRRPLPTRSEWVAVEIPPEILFELETAPTDALAACVEIPDELLWLNLQSPKRKRGRPRNKALQALANSQRCSIRHARRLLASGKQRERVRKYLSPSEEWALQQQKKRAKLVQALEQELSINQLAHCLNLSYHWEAYTTALDNSDDDLVVRLLSAETNSWARQLAERMAAEKGSLAALGFVRQSLGLQPSVIPSAAN